MPSRQPGLVWDRSEAARGALCVAPGAALVLAGETGRGLFLTVGVLPVAMLGIPQTRQAVIRLLTVGALFAVTYALGSIVGTAPVVAVITLTSAAYLATVAMTRSPVARLTAGLLVPVCGPFEWGLVARA